MARQRKRGSARSPAPRAGGNATRRRASAELPVLGAPPPGRADAARNREKVLAAARDLFEQRGVANVTIDEIARAAGVGKGTVFHRFGDRDGLTGALTDEYMRAFQDDFLRGSPPLGPGAPPQARLEAFFAELVRLQVDHLELALAAERAVTREMPPVYGVLVMHIGTLIAEIDPALDAGLLSAYLLSAIAPPVLDRLHSGAGVEVAALQRSVIQLIRGITS